MKGVYIVILLIASLTGCKPPVTFNEPQPPEAENLARFPIRLQGQFSSLNDNSMLLINDRLIQRIIDYTETTHMNQLDSSMQILGDTIFDLTTNEKTFFTREGDSLILRIHYIDTIFKIDYNNIVRGWRGNYFLNTLYDNSGWEVKKVHLSKGQLSISSISSELEMENLKEITETPDDTVAPFKLSPNKKAFKKFVRKDGFADTEIFVKQK